MTWFDLEVFVASLTACVITFSETSFTKFFVVEEDFFVGSRIFFVFWDDDFDAVEGNTFGCTDLLTLGGLIVSVLAILPVSKLLAVLVLLALLIMLDVLFVLPTVDVDDLRRSCKSGLSAMNARIFLISKGAVDGSFAFTGTCDSTTGALVSFGAETIFAPGRPVALRSASLSCDFVILFMVVFLTVDEESDFAGTVLTFGMTFERVAVEAVLAKGLATLTDGRAPLVVVVVVDVDMIKLV